jgi:AcrR family transcriptional regulator
VAPFSLLSPHGQALIRIAQDPQVRVSDIAEALAMTERNAQRIVADLISAGHVDRKRQGRRNAFTISSDQLRTGLLALRDFDADVPAASNGQPKKKQEIQARLLAAAEQTLNDGETFAELSVERLITAAGISRSTFYAYFQDKDDLLQALVENVLEELWAAARAWTDLGPGLSKDDLRAAITRIGTVHRPHRLVMAAAAEADQANAQVRAEYDVLMERTTQLVRDHIARGQAQGFVRAELDPQNTAALLTWGSELRLNKLAANASDEKLGHVVTALTDLIWNLLYAGVR